MPRLDDNDLSSTGKMKWAIEELRARVEELMAKVEEIAARLDESRHPTPPNIGAGLENLIRPQRGPGRPPKDRAA